MTSATPSRTQRWQNHLKERNYYQQKFLQFTIRRLYHIRNDFACKYLRGKGFEIGAQNSPLQCKNAQEIRYIDYLSKAESSKKYNIPSQECVDVDIIADANNLEDFQENSTNFIIANHVLEHSPNPIHALLGWLRILKPGGLLFLTLPHNSSNEFDFEKTLTKLSHFIDDFQRAKNREDITSVHIHEHVQIIDGINPENKVHFQKRCDELIKSNLHTHYHVFNKSNCFELLSYIHGLTPITIRNFYAPSHGFELLFIIEKGSENSDMRLKFQENRAFNYTVMLRNFFILLWLKIVASMRT